jgi:hypothetical protein
MSNGYKIIYPKVDRNKPIELGHIIRGTYPTTTEGASYRSRQVLFKFTKGH